MGPEMADDRDEKPLAVRSPESGVEAARESEERRRVAEIACEFQELGRTLDERDRLARFSTAKRAESLPAQAGQPASGIGDRPTPESEPLPTVADMSSAPKEIFPQGGKVATIPARRQQRKRIAEGGRLTTRRKWRLSFAAVIVVLSLVSGGTLMLMGTSIEIAQDAYRSAVAEMQRLTVRENADTEAAARKAAKEKTMAEEAERAAKEKAMAEEAERAAKEKAMAEEAERKAAEEKLAAAAVARRQEEEAQLATEEKARAAAAREMAQARTAAPEATKRLTVEDVRLKAEEPSRKAVEGKPKLAAEVRQQAERAEANLTLSEQDRKRVQAALNALGHEIPAVTGHFGPRTRAMIAAWQKKQGLPETAFLDESQLAALREQATLAIRADETRLHARQQAEKVESGLKLSEQDRRRVQVALYALSHKISTPTGYFGPRTREMIMAWQKTQGLPETGYLTEAQLEALRHQAAAALAKYDRAQAERQRDPRGTE